MEVAKSGGVWPPPDLATSMKFVGKLGNCLKMAEHTDKILRKNSENMGENEHIFGQSAENWDKCNVQENK